MQARRGEMGSWPVRRSANTLAWREQHIHLPHTFEIVFIKQWIYEQGTPWPLTVAPDLVVVLRYCYHGSG